MAGVLISWLLAAPLAPAQLTAEQKAVDFQAIVAPYAKWYAPYEWKRDQFGYDLLNLAPWLTEARATTNDLDYYDILVRYIAQLHDSHSGYSLPSSFAASLGIHVDAYFDAGRQNYQVLIDRVSRSVLPRSQYPFEAGDELVSIDGVPVATLVAQFSPYVSGGNADARLREAVYYLTVRPQQILPRAHEIGDFATLEIKRQSGAQETYVLPWWKSGAPLTVIGPAPAFTTEAEAASPAPAVRTLREILKKYDVAHLRRPVEVLNFGSLWPVWDFPSSFQPRLGAEWDDFTSGVMMSEGYRIGYLRIPAFEPLFTDEDAFDQLDAEITYLQRSTDALVLDVMRNPGGYMCYTEELLKRFMTGPWRAMGSQFRVSWEDYYTLQEWVDNVRALGYPAGIVAAYQQLADEHLAAYQGNRLTIPCSVCDTSLDRSPEDGAYTKPILLLTDEFSASAADSFAAVFQDNGRGKVFGYRTNGAGGSVISGSAGFFSESGSVSVTNSLMYRPNAVNANGFTDTHTVENVGVQPDAPYDYMQPENLRLRGKPFVDAFLAEIVSQLRAAGVSPSGATASTAAAQGYGGREGSSPPRSTGSGSGGVR